MRASLVSRLMDAVISGFISAELGRKNFLFVGDEETGGNLAGLYSLVATCDSVGSTPSSISKM